jgi:hypothetical protein
MVATKEAQKIRMEMAKDIKFFIEVLESYFDSISDARSIVKILENKNNIPTYDYINANPNNWGYDVSIMLPLTILSGMKPLSIQLSSLEFSMKIIANSANYKNDYYDPLVYLEFNLLTIGYSTNGRGGMVHSLHLDRHPNNSYSDDPHPKYHFQFGGRKLSEKITNDAEYGKNMFFDAPRIMHYPMDFILGIDFILSNYYSSVWNTLKETNHQYNSLIAKYQEIFLKPYFNSMSQHWSIRTPFTQRDWNTQDICPQIVERLR